MSRLSGKIAIITGAASGIGKAMARRFAAEGAAVLASDVDEARLMRVVDGIVESGGAATAQVCDISERASAEGLVAAALSAHGRLDILCNNAGVLDNLTPLADCTDALWRTVMGVNLDGPFFACRAAIPAMIAAGGGAIVNTASAAGVAGGRGGAAYTASKHALVGMTRNVAWFYGPSGIRCNAIAPGAIATPMAGRLVPNPDGFARMRDYFSTVPPMGKPDAVADAALFLASDEGRYVSGAVLSVDGGWLSY
ncbi:MAG: glucose 1-dehydrogenase [Myxococcota bacterium]|nr:glucose 1-dehydrogenase [Myxococcota bacterium]